MALLSVADLRLHVTSALTDAALQLLLDAAEAAIVEVAGASGEVTEYPSGGYPRIVTGRAIGTLASVTDGATVLTATDYRASGYVLTRLADGPNPGYLWGDVVVVYTPADDTAERKRVQLALVQLDLTYQPGITAETVGTWQVSYGANSVWNYDLERAAILASLGAGTGMVII